jgi:hypothetical protein
MPGPAYRDRHVATRSSCRMPPGEINCRDCPSGGPPISWSSPTAPQKRAERPIIKLAAMDLASHQASRDIGRLSPNLGWSIWGVARRCCRGFFSLLRCRAR